MSFADMLFAGTVASTSHPGRLVKALVTGESDNDDDEYEIVGLDGYAFRPRAGAEVIVVTGAGDADVAYIVAAVDRVKAPKGLKEGERVLYNADGEVLVRLDPDKPKVLRLADGDGQSVEMAQASDNLVKYTPLRQELDALWSALGAHTHPVSTTGSATAQTGSTTGVLGASKTSQDFKAADVLGS